MSALFYAARFTPAADITALLFLSVLFTVLLAAVFLKERVGFGRWVAIPVGFAGALIVIRPGFEAASWPALIMLFVALAFGAVNTATRFLAGAENPNAIVFYMYGLMCLYALVPTILVWQTPAWTDVPWLAATGAFAAVAQQGITALAFDGADRDRHARLLPAAPLRRGGRLLPVRRGAGGVDLARCRGHLRRDLLRHPRRPAGAAVRATSPRARPTP